MPGRRTKPTFAAAALVVALLIAGCAGTENHTWQGEFTERLEGASAAIEARLPELQPESSYDELFKAGIRLGQELEFKGELITKLNPPGGCEVVQEGGQRKVTGTAQFTYDLYKNLTPYLHRELSKDLETRIAELEAVEREAAHCESS
jgi:hypothetical protein